MTMNSTCFALLYAKEQAEINSFIKIS
jgi:hypothetical protein